MSRFLTELDLIPLLSAKPTEAVFLPSDEVCTPAHLFLAIARLRASDDTCQDTEDRLSRRRSTFHQRVDQSSLTVLNVADGMNMLFEEDTVLSNGLINHHKHTKSPPEDTVEIVCREIVERHFGW